MFLFPGAGGAGGITSAIFCFYFENHTKEKIIMLWFISKTK
jgi:hypothetical protein